MSGLSENPDHPMPVFNFWIEIEYTKTVLCSYSIINMRPQNMNNKNIKAKF